MPFREEDLMVAELQENQLKGRKRWRVREKMILLFNDSPSPAQKLQLLTSGIREESIRIEVEKTAWGRFVGRGAKRCPPVSGIEKGEKSTSEGKI